MGFAGKNNLRPAFSGSPARGPGWRIAARPVAPSKAGRRRRLENVKSGETLEGYLEP